jgi:hypothetical protein
MIARTVAMLPEAGAGLIPCMRPANTGRGLSLSVINYAYMQDRTGVLFFELRVR